MPRYLDGLESIQAIHITKFKDKPRQTTKLPWSSFQGDARSEPCLKDTPLQLVVALWHTYPKTF